MIKADFGWPANRFLFYYTLFTIELTAFYWVYSNTFWGLRGATVERIPDLGLKVGLAVRSTGLLSVIIVPLDVYIKTTEILEWYWVLLIVRRILWYIKLIFAERIWERSKWWQGIRNDDIFKVCGYFEYRLVTK